MKTPPPSPSLKRPEAVPSSESSAVAMMRASRDLVQRAIAACGRGLEALTGGTRQHITPGEAVNDLMAEDPTALVDLLRQATRLPRTLHVAAEKALLKIGGERRIVAVVNAIRADQKLLFTVHAAMVQSHGEDDGIRMAI